MKYKCIISTAVAGMFLISCGSSKKVASETEVQVKGAAVKDIAIDGSANDWNDFPLQMSPTGNFEYAVVHNNDDLFILLKVASTAEQTKLLRSGLEIWIDPTGQKNKTTEVIYPVKGELSEDALKPQNISSDPKVNLAQMHMHITTELISLNRIGFKPEASGVQSIHQNTGFKAALNWNDYNDLIYELKIPVSAFRQKLPKNNINIGFALNGIERPKDSENGAPQQQGGGGFNRGGGMRGGGMRGGGGYRGGQDGKRRNNAGGDNTADWKKVYEKESFWVNYTM